MLPENIYLSFGPGTREHQERIAADTLALLNAGFIDQQLALRGAVAQAYQAGYNRGFEPEEPVRLFEHGLTTLTIDGTAQPDDPASWALVPKT